jgi:hypothetical protein
VLVPVTVPIVGLIESEVAPETLQLKVEVPFRATEAGEAEKERIERGFCTFTVVDVVEVLL